MNTFFAEVNNLLNPAARPDGALASKGKGGQGKGQNGDGFVFASRLEKEVRKLDISQGGRQAVSAETGIDGKGQPQTPGQVTQGREGIKFLAGLEKALMKISGGDLNTITMDAQGLDVLKELLIQAGFDPDRVSELLGGLKEKLEAQPGKEGIKLGEVMDLLAPLALEDDTGPDTEDVFLETSALPFITTLLDALHLPKDLTSAIIERADAGKKGVNLNALVEALKEVDSGLDQAGKSLEIPGNTPSYKNIMDRLGAAWAGKEGGQEPVSLKDILSAFDAHIKSRTSARETAVEARQAPSGKTAEDFGGTAGKNPLAGALVDRFFASLTLAGDKGDSSGFSFQEVKDQFKTDLLVPDKGKKNKPSLFAGNRPGSDGTSPSMLEEVKPLIARQGEGGLAASSGREKPGRDVEGELRPSTLKSGDISQAGAALGKADTGENPLNGLKAKPAERPLPSYVTHQVNRSIVRAVNNGETSLKIQLKPAELGRLMLTIDNAGNSIKVSIITENHAAKELLSSNVNELKSTLASAGISLDSFDVDMSQDFRQSMADTGNQAGNFGGKNGRNSKSGLGAGEGDAQDLHIEPGSGITQDGTYHFVA